MNDETLPPAETTVETTPPEVAAPVVKAKPKKASKKLSKPKVAKPAAKKADKPKAEPKPAKVKAPKEKKEDARKVSGLRRFQVRTLKVLSESVDQLPVASIAKKAKISHTMVVMGLGTIDPKLLKSHDKKMGFPSLITLGHVKVVEIENITAIQITASGKKALTSELSKVGGKLPKVRAAAPVAA